MPLFRRNKTEEDVIVPEEVQTYYQEERRSRRWLAWLLAFGTLLATVLITLGLFYGGRWAYHKLRPTAKPGNVGVQNEPISKPQKSDDQPATGTTPPATSPASPNNSAQPQTPTTPPTVATGTTTPPATGTTPPATSGNTTPQTSSTSTSASNVANPGKDTVASSLPDTGPGDSVALFLATSFAAYVLHRRISRIR